MLKSRLIPQQLIVFCLFTILIVTALNLQTTVWFNLFGYFPSPCFWMPFFVYLTMNRPLPKNLLWLGYFYILFLTQTSAIPFTLFISMITLWAIIQFFQKRVSTLGLFDFILFSAGSVALFPLIYFGLSLLGSSSSSLDIISILVSLFLSMPIIPLALVICKKIDSTFDPLNNADNLVLDI